MLARPSASSLPKRITDELAVPPRMPKIPPYQHDSRESTQDIAHILRFILLFEELVHQFPSSHIRSCLHPCHTHPRDKFLIPKKEAGAHIGILQITGMCCCNHGVLNNNDENAKPAFFLLLNTKSKKKGSG